jgi:hypothetical protein
LIALGGAISLAAAMFSVSGRASAQANTQASHFIQVATAANTIAEFTKIDNGATNNQPNDLLFVTPDYNPGELCGCIADRVPVGVDYDTSTDAWYIFNEDGSSMTAGTAFNVLVVPSASTTAFVWTATTSNSEGDSTFINSSATNGLPKAVLQVTQRFNGIEEDDPVGVWYEKDASEWAIFNEDAADIDTTGQDSFDVLVGATQSGGGKDLVQKATSANSLESWTVVNSAITNGDPNAFAIETPDWNPGGKGGTYTPWATGVFDETIGQLAVLIQNGETMAPKMAFNMLLYNS